MEYASFILRSALALVFLSAAGGKATNMRSFSGTLAALSVAAPARPALGWSLAIAEAATGVLLLILFVSASLVAHRRAERISCACFGRAHTVLGLPTLARALLLGAATIGFAGASFDGPAGWWPWQLDALVPSVALVAAVLLLGRWLFAGPAVAALARSRGRARAGVMQSARPTGGLR